MIKKCRLALKVSLAMLMTVFLVIPSSESRSEELVEKVEYWSSRVIAESLYIKSNTYRESIKASSGNFSPEGWENFVSLMRENKLLELSEIGCVVTPVPKITDIRKRAGNPNIWILNVNTIIHFIACKNQPSKKLNSVVKVTEERFSTEQIKDGTRLKIISWDTGLENARN